MKLEEKEEKKKLIRELMNSELYSPMKVKELGAFMQVPKGDKRVFRLILEEMMAEAKNENEREMFRRKLDELNRQSNQW
jgi:ribonuclease R